MKYPLRYPIARECGHGEYIVLSLPKATRYKRLKEEQKKLCASCAVLERMSPKDSN